MSMTSRLVCLYESLLKIDVNKGVIGRVRRPFDQTWLWAIHGLMLGSGEPKDCLDVVLLSNWLFLAVGCESARYAHSKILVSRPGVKSRAMLLNVLH